MNGSFTNNQQVIEVRNIENREHLLIYIITIVSLTP